MDAIVEAAVRILLKDGYAQLTTKSVAEVAGVSVGSLYQYFPNKQTILAEIIRRRTAEVIAAIAKACEGAATLEAFAGCLVGAFLKAKHDKIALSTALREPMVEIDGYDIMRESAKDFVSILAGLLDISLSRPLTETQRDSLILAVTAIQSAVSLLIASNPQALSDPTTHRTLTRMFVAALSGDESSTA